MSCEGTVCFSTSNALNIVPEDPSYAGEPWNRPQPQWQPPSSEMAKGRAREGGPVCKRRADDFEQTQQCRANKRARVLR